MFGPYYVKDRRTELKRWGFMITCLYSRAVHIELLEDMSTDTFIQALRCFMAVRRPVNTIICDNGTNIVGAKNELEKELDQAEPSLMEYLLQTRIDFKFNSPNASQQGGVTERMIRSVKAVLNGMARKHRNRMDKKTLRTGFNEAVNIVNNRPLTAAFINNPEDNIITPNQLLTMKDKTVRAPPPGKFHREDMYGKSRWKASQQWAEEFWSAWKSDYLQVIMVRQKWQMEKENIKVGDVVIVKDDSIARGDWRIGVVTEARGETDGLVRNVEVRLGNRNLDKKEKILREPTVFRRPIQKVVVLVKAE